MMLDRPVFEGTPDEWWEGAERITNAESAAKELGSWYISRNSRNGSYYLYTPTIQHVRLNKTRLNSQEHKWETGYPDAENPAELSEKTRLLFRQKIEIPEWQAADMIMANIPESRARDLWKRQADWKWCLVMDGRVKVDDYDMAELDPKTIDIRER